MPQRWLPFLLITLIVLQSVATLTGGHSFCQDDAASGSLVVTAKAQAIDHSAPLTASTTRLNADSAPHSASHSTPHASTNDDCQDSRQAKDDCHNCGHCHGHFNSALLATSFGFFATHSPNPVPAYLARAPQQFTGRFLRPPIA